MVKAYVCKAAEWVTREAMQIHGGMGYAEEYDVSRYFVDARVLSIFEGADETLCLKVIARQLVADAPPCVGRDPDASASMVAPRPPAGWPRQGRRYCSCAHPPRLRGTGRCGGRSASRPSSACWRRAARSARRGRPRPSHRHSRRHPTASPSTTSPARPRRLRRHRVAHDGARRAVRAPPERLGLDAARRSRSRSTGWVACRAAGSMTA